MDNSCSICHRNNNQLLMLSCGHDPCIDCATSNYFSGTQYRKQFQYLRQANYWCQVCDQPTSIDQNTIQQLVNYAGLNAHSQGNTIRSEETLKRSKSYQRKSISKNQNIVYLSPKHEIPARKVSKERKKSHNHHQHGAKAQQIMVSSQQFRHGRLVGHHQYNQAEYKNSLKHHHSGDHFLFQSNRTEPSPAAHPPCYKHSDQFLSYYCFSCNCSICVECAIHGSHIGHQVQAIKKAGNRLKASYQKLVSQSQKNRTHLDNNIKDMDKMMSDYKMCNEKHRTKIKQKFAELFEILTEKQNSLLLEIDRIENQNLNNLLQLKYKYEDNLSVLKIKRKKLKQCLNVSPIQWNISELQAAKNELKLVCEGSILEGSLKKIEGSIKQVETQLVIQALDTMSDFALSLKIEAESKKN